MNITKNLVLVAVFILSFIVLFILVGENSAFVHNSLTPTIATICIINMIWTVIILIIGNLSED